MQTDTAAPQVVTSPVIVFGRDDKGKPHASRFEADEAPLAEKAAGLMGMQVLRVISNEAVSLAAGLPSGRIFASGRGFVPFVKAELFAKLAAAPDAFAPPAPPPDPAASPLGKPKGGLRAVAGANAANAAPEPADSVGAPPTDWAGIALGSLVLAAEEGTPTIWYVATVVADRGEDLFELRWFDTGGEDLPLIVRRREHLGLFPPAVAGALGE